MSKSIRIRTTPGGSDNFVKVKLDQDFDFIEILSLKISQEEVYRKFCADYGVIVGRVIANDGFGVPNAKLSVFIPIRDEDKDNVLISSIYPYETVTDKDKDGVRYNLLPKSKQSQCHEPVGSMPSKREVLDNDITLEIYDKYYKFTTTTNQAGDYMIFGVPTGSNIIHMDVDISDIGVISQRPYDMIRQGSNKKQFESPTKFKSGKNLDSLTQIKSSNVGVNVLPFWGDSENCEVGISRVDINLPYLFEPSALFMGSLFSDSDKHSVNKNCRPMKKTGKLCEMVTGQGFIEMIRKNLDDKIERYDVEGLSAIDENGAWAYQIPMNLDYKVTDEYGNLVDSGDPTKGIPTRSRVRFRVGMWETGKEGRIRTRAKYLIPNNPNNADFDDYTFDETTSDKSFVDLHWNKVYTVRNFIARYQKTDGIDNRNFIGIKDVDNCGTHTPFPFNRIDTDFNPLYTILCFIILVIANIIKIINEIIIPIINSIVSVVRAIIKFLYKICNVLNLIPGVSINCENFEEPDYAKCITQKCGDIIYAPGCGSGTKGYEALGSPHPENDTDKFIECLRAKLADALNVFELDFYNDWINGSLYLPLLKYKNKKNGSVEKFCEYDCSGSGTFTGRDGTDNKCEGSNYLIDSCAGSVTASTAKDKKYIEIKDGVIKKVGDELYYPCRTHITKDLMYATNITLIGSMLDCDAGNIPVIHNKLIPTTYNRPDFSKGEYDDECALEGVIFKDISCLNLDSKGKCDNIKRINEIGVDIPTDITCNVNNSITDSLIRGQIIGMNITPMELIPTNVDSDFSGYHYDKFRGYGGSLSLPQNNSLFFYFGIVPGQSAIEKANVNFFNQCYVPEKYDFIIDGTVTNNITIGGSIGGITIEIIDGISPYTYEWRKDGSQSIFSTSQNISNLVAGVYKIIVTDSLKAKSEASFTITEPQTLNFNISSIDTTFNGGSDGQILVSSLYSGIGPYVVKIISGPSSVNTTYSVTNGSVLFTDLKSGTYSVTVTDEDGLGTTLTKSIFVNDAPKLTASITPKNITCYGESDGEININVIGGIPPYTIKTTNGSTFESSEFNIIDLAPGTYQTIVTDSVGTTDTKTSTITQPNAIGNNSYGGKEELTYCYTIPLINITQCGISYNPKQYKYYIKLNANGGSGEYTYVIGNGGPSNTYTGSGEIEVNTYNNSILTPNTYYNIRITDSNGCDGPTIKVLVQ